jgi:hypothetical protein
MVKNIWLRSWKKHADLARHKKHVHNTSDITWEEKSNHHLKGFLNILGEELKDLYYDLLFLQYIFNFLYITDSKEISCFGKHIKSS